MTSISTTSFRLSLRRARLRWQAGLLVVAACDGAATCAAAFLLLALADLAFVPESAGRQGMLVAGLALTGLATLIGLVRMACFRDRDMAGIVDQRQDARRRPVFGTWELLRQQIAADADTPLRAYLLDTAAQRGTAQLQSLPLAGQLPWQRLGRSLAVLACALALGTASVLVNTPAMRTALNRVLHPDADIPPYSSLVFRVTPATPTLLYGGSTNLLVEITGGPVQGNVWLVTRDNGRVNRSVCFQEAPTRFGQRLEQVVQPVEFCFATRRARSPWHRIDLRLQPLISLSLLTIDPPAYSGLPREQAVAGREPLKALRGSRIALYLSSNRPLLDGKVTIRALDGTGTREIVGRLDSRQTVVFEWPLEAPAEIEASIRDVQGTACRQPLKLSQQIRPDLPPVVTITDPPLFAVATPTSHLPLSGTVEDDLGLRRAELVRTVVGFRDRTEALPVPPGGRRMDFTRDLSLSALGVVPGQTLEFYFEAADSNPSLAGLGVSEVATVRIIADEEYANMIRTRTSMDQFGDRFRLLADQMEAYRKAVQALQESAKPGTSKEQQQAALDRAREEARRTAELAHKIADDFPIYDQEKMLAATIRESLGDLDRWSQELQNAQVGITHLAGTAAHILDGLGKPQQAVAAQQEKAAETEAASRVMWLSADFRALLERQRLLVRRLENIEQSTRLEDREQVPGLAKRQEEIERQLAEFVRELRLRSGVLPKDLEELQTSAQKFATAVEECGAATNMTIGAAAARNARLREARMQAQEARDKLEAMLSRCCSAGNGFAGLCQGKMQFKVPEEMKNTFAQMLAGILRGQGRGGNGAKPGTEGGGGMGGSPDDGYWMSGSTPLNIPTYGPPRADFSRPGIGGFGAAGQGRGNGTGSGVLQNGTRERLGTAEPTRTRTTGMSPELLPEKYRDAVKRYFGGKE